MGPLWGGEGALVMGTWLQGGHWHPCGDTRGDCHPRDPKWPRLALSSVGTADSCKFLGGAVSPGGLLGGW